MSDFRETPQERIDMKIAELLQQKHFALYKYDYHHKNDELQIIEEQMNILNQAASTYTRFLNEMQKFKQTLQDARQLSHQYDELIRSQPTTQHQNERQHETTPQHCIKDKFKDTNLKKNLFPPA